MSGATTELSLATAVDSDDNADYLTLSLANSLRTVDALFNNVTGHTHNGAHQGAPVPASTIPNGSISNAQLGPDVARANLLTNGGFEIWQRGNGPFVGVGAGSSPLADRWAVSGSGSGTLTVARDTANADTGSGACASVTYTHAAGSVINTQQVLSAAEYPEFKGRVVSLSVRVKTLIGNMVRVGVHDGAAWQYSPYHNGNGTYQTLTVTVTLAAGAGAWYVGIWWDNAISGLAYLDNAMLVVGSQPADYAPLHPADDLARCLRYFQVIGGTNGSRICLAQAYAPNAALGVVTYLQKPVTPTLTANGGFVATQASGTQVGATLGASTITQREAEIDATTSGMVAGNATMLMAAAASASSINVEANP